MDVVLKVVVEYRAAVGDARARRTVVAGGHAAVTSYQSAVSKNSRCQYFHWRIQGYFVEFGRTTQNYTHKIS